MVGRPEYSGADRVFPSSLVYVGPLYQLLGGFDIDDRALSGHVVVSQLHISQPVLQFLVAADWIRTGDLGPINWGLLNMHAKGQGCCIIVGRWRLNG